MKRAALVVAALALGACGGDVHKSWADKGAALAGDPTLTQSRYNVFACTTCHAATPAEVGDRILPGAVLEGASARPSWWGGNVVDLSTAVDDCVQTFMQGERLDPNGDDAQALLAYLDSLSASPAAGTTDAVPFTLPATIQDIPDGDATRGEDTYRRACAGCHGARSTGDGRLGPLVPNIPDSTVAEHGYLGPACLRLIFVEKVRHGSFLGYAGTMPPFSTQVLDDGALSDVLSYLGVPPSGGMCTM